MSSVPNKFKIAFQFSLTGLVDSIPDLVMAGIFLATWHNVFLFGKIAWYEIIMILEFVLVIFSFAYIVIFLGTSQKNFFKRAWFLFYFFFMSILVGYIISTLVGSTMVFVGFCIASASRILSLRRLKVSTDEERRKSLLGDWSLDRAVVMLLLFFLYLFLSNYLPIPETIPKDREVLFNFIPMGFLYFFTLGILSIIGPSLYLPFSVKIILRKLFLLPLIDLGLTGGKLADFIEISMDDSEESADLHPEALNLAELKVGGKTKAETLLDDLRDDNPDIRRDAAWKLREVNAEQAREPLISALRDHEATVRMSAAKALGEIKDIRAVQPLITALRDDNYMVRISAVLALGKIQDSRAAGPLKAALKDNHENVRSAAAEALEKLSEQSAEQKQEGKPWWRERIKRR